MGSADLRKMRRRLPRKVQKMLTVLRARAGFAAALCVIFCAAPLSPELFRFKHAIGDTSRILTTVKENVFYNSMFSHRAEILNRISVEVTDVQGSKGKLEAAFMTSERSTGAEGNTFEWGKEYKSVFLRDPKGKYEIDDIYFMPVVRDVPLFPDEEIKPGAKWSARGEEAHDLRRTFNIEKPYKVPFTADYEYTGTLTAQDGKTLHIITAKYKIQFQTPSTTRSDIEIPLLTEGFSNQIIYFDIEKGAIDHYTEEFSITIKTNKGNVYLFEGTSRGEVTEYVTNTVNQIDEARQKIETLNLENVAVVADEKGLTFRIENIQFLPDSAILRESEKEKLKKLAEILAEFPGNDLLVSGHTALAGTAPVRQKLSEDRARSVADYLLSIGARDAYHIFTQGFGAEKPVAPNTTEANREKNRRVEITILNK
jgi:outer membrane protein OmpA-like peptidoglycan-associated protein